MKFLKYTILVFLTMLVALPSIKVTAAQDGILSDEEESFIKDYRKKYTGDEYGGMHLDENGNIVIKLVNYYTVNQDTVMLNKDIQSYINDFSTVSQSVKYEKAKYTLAFLENACDSISQYMAQFKIFGIGVDEEKNKIVIETSEITDKLKEKVEEYVSLDAVIFHENLNCRYSATILSIDEPKEMSIKINNERAASNNIELPK